MNAQRERARADAKSKRAVVSVADVPATRSEFTGYGGLEGTGNVVAILVGGVPVERVEAGADAQIVLDATSFYAEKGGQIGDHGTLSSDEGAFEVSDTQFAGEAIAHHGRVTSGSLTVGDSVRTAVFPEWREEIRRHHTSAHLLQRALKEILGDEVMQAGSWVGIDRMRFDFRSPVGALSQQQKRAVAERVNDLIRSDFHLETEQLGIEQAQASGAISMAGENYGDVVRVVKAGPSVEFCGGTHAHSTGELGLFVILSEASIGSGVRRIEAVVSKAAEQYVERQQDTLARTLRGALGEARRIWSSASAGCRATCASCRKRSANSKRAWPPPMRRRTSSARSASTARCWWARSCARRAPNRCVRSQTRFVRGFRAA